MHSPEGRSSEPQLELNLDDYTVNGGSIACSRDATTFAFTIGPLSSATMAALAAAADKQARICVYCCRQPVLFDLDTLERKEARRVRLVGRFVRRAAIAIGKNK